NKAMGDTYRLAQQIRTGNLAEFGGNIQVAEQALRDRLRLGVEALGNSRAMTAAAGRAMRRMRTEFAMTPEKLAAMDGMDMDQMIELIYASKGNPKELAKMADPGLWDRVTRGAGTLMANNLLWGWPTH